MIKPKASLDHSLAFLPLFSEFRRENKKETYEKCCGSVFSVDLGGITELLGRGADSSKQNNYLHGD